MNEDKVIGGRVLTMFIIMRNAELKNVRTLEHDNKEMVTLLTRFIEREANKDVGTGGDES